MALHTTVEDRVCNPRKEIAMKSGSIRTTKPDRKTSAPRPQPTGPAAQRLHAPPLSPCDDLHVLIAQRAYELYGERGYRGESALDDWLDAEREILSQIPPA
jgi:hypothetical protein